MYYLIIEFGDPNFIYTALGNQQINQISLGTAEFKKKKGLISLFVSSHT